METRNKIKSPEQASSLIKAWKKGGEKVVFTNGCFDILHLGHIDYLEKARNLGDHLIIGLNTDKSVQKIKGPSRPLNNETARARVLASLAFTDLVVMFDEDTPLELIKQLKPDILVKGKDYHTKNIVGANFVMDIGGKVITLDLVEGYSTTGLIEKIKKN